MKNNKTGGGKRWKKWGLAILIFLMLASLIGVSLLTTVHDYDGLGDYADIAQHFAGHYSADVRTSHSLLYGFAFHAGQIGEGQRFWNLKLVTIHVMALIALATWAYLGFRRREGRATLALLAVSPVLWYLAPWISPIPLAALLLFGSWIFLENENELKDLIVSGLLLGLALSFWDGMMFFAGIFTLCYFYNRKMSDLMKFCLGVLLGTIPLLILNQIIYGFAFYSFFKYFIVTGVFSVFGNIWQAGGAFTWANYAAILLTFPIMAWSLFFRRDVLKKETKTMTFLALSLAFIFLCNPQIRYTFVVLPIITVIMARYLKTEQLKWQLIASIVGVLLVMSPYVVQMMYSTPQFEATRVVQTIGGGIIKGQWGHLTFSPLDYGLGEDGNLQKAIDAIVKRHPNETFIVGPAADDYQEIARNYWGNDVKEFVSIQDYESWVLENPVYFNKTLTFHGNFIAGFSDRRQVWISGGIGRNTEDKTDFSRIRYAIGLHEPVQIKGFKTSELHYGVLYLSEREVKDEWTTKETNEPNELKEIKMTNSTWDWSQPPSWNVSWSLMNSSDWKTFQGI